MSEIKVNKLSPRSGTTVTLGDSGDTFTIPSGATISNAGTAAGFGSTGEVSWNTTKISSDPNTAATGVGYFTDTSGAAFNVTLPASPSAGNVVAVADYANTWDTNNLTIVRNGSNIEGSAENFVCNQEGAVITFVYVDATKGWVCTNSGNSTQAFVHQYVQASGGTESTCGDFKYHKFTGPGSFVVTDAGVAAGSNKLTYLVVAGGGAGGNRRAGGGGGGGLRIVSCETAAVQTYPVTVGAGGTANSPQPIGGDTPVGGSGANSVFSSTTSAGGGGGGGADQNGANGGSGGGGGSKHPSGTTTGGSGNTPPVSPAQGNDGGDGFGTNAGGFHGAGAGGGGSNAAAANATAPVGGAGGAGTDVTPNFPAPLGGSPAGNYAGGGGGGYQSSTSPGSGGSGGAGGGTAGSACGGTPPTAATANTGGGSGGVGSPAPSAAYGNGGSGIVIVKYKFQN
jgi:hypothetical protein